MRRPGSRPRSRRGPRASGRLAHDSPGSSGDAPAGGRRRAANAGDTRRGRGRERAPEVVRAGRRRRRGRAVSSRSRSRCRARVNSVRVAASLRPRTSAISRPLAPRAAIHGDPRVGREGEEGVAQAGLDVQPQVAGLGDRSGASAASRGGRRRSGPGLGLVRREDHGPSVRGGRPPERTVTGPRAAGDLGHGGGSIGVRVHHGPSDALARPDVSGGFADRPARSARPANARPGSAPGRDMAATMASMPPVRRWFSRRRDAAPAGRVDRLDRG